MKKNKALAYAVLAIIFALFNVIAFVIPTAKTETFWIAYVFTAVAFLSQIAIWKLAFNGANTLKSKFLGIPLVSVGSTYLFVQLIAFAVFMACPLIPGWVAVVVGTLILGISAICLIGTEASRDEIGRIEKKVDRKVFYTKSLQIEIEMLARAETDSGAKDELTKLADKIRYSDPISNEALADLESEIVEKVNELKTTENKSAVITDLDSLITQRNKKIRLLK